MQVELEGGIPSVCDEKVSLLFTPKCTYDSRYIVCLPYSLSQIELSAKDGQAEPNSDLTSSPDFASSTSCV